MADNYEDKKITKRDFDDAIDLYKGFVGDLQQTNRKFFDFKIATLAYQHLCVLAWLNPWHAFWIIGKRSW